MVDAEDRLAVVTGGSLALGLMLRQRESVPSSGEVQRSTDKLEQ